MICKHVENTIPKHKRIRDCAECSGASVCEVYLEIKQLRKELNNTKKLDIVDRLRNIAQEITEDRKKR
jgi:hypothetical protein